MSGWLSGSKVDLHIFCQYTYNSGGRKDLPYHYHAMMRNYISRWSEQNIPRLEWLSLFSVFFLNS